MSLSQEFIARLQPIQNTPLAPETAIAAKVRCLDYLGALAGGVTQGVLAGRLLPHMKADGECQVLGTKKRGTCFQAAQMNGVTGHGLELDDGDRKSYGHPAVVTFSALFPLAEKHHATGRDFLAAATAGYEAYCRLGRAVNPGTLRRGFHTSGVVGCLSTAVACAHLLKFTEEQTLNAMATAALMSSGLCITFHSGGMLKPLNAGHAAQNAVQAVELVARGAEGAPDILEGKDGFLHAYSGQEIDEKILLRPLEHPFGIEGSYIKFYPSCRYTHAPIDCSLQLRDKVKPEDIQTIEIITYPTALYLAGKSELPHDGLAARFNIGFAAALALVYGQPRIADFSAEKAKDPKIEVVFRKIRFIEDPAYDNPNAGVRGAAMNIVTAGETFSVQVPLPVGEPENPAPAEMYERKFADLAAGVWTPARQKEIRAKIGALESVTDMAGLVPLLENDVA